MTELLSRLPGLHDAVTLRLLLPVLLAFALAGLFRLVAGTGRRVLASASVIVSAIVVQMLVAGMPLLPPSSPVDKIGWLTLAGLAFGLILDFFRIRALAWALVVVWPAIVIGWIGDDRLLSIPGLAAQSPEGALESLIGITLFVGFWVAGITITARLRESRDGNSAVMLLVAAVALGGILLHAGLPGLGTTALALASSIGGFLLWNLGRNRLPFGDGAILGSVSLLFAIGATFGVSSRSAVAIVVLMLLILVFFADRSARRLTPGNGTPARLAAPLVLAAAAAIPALAATAVAILAL